MQINSLDQLIKIREGAMKKVNLRESGEDAESITELMVGMATCGIAAGAQEALDALLDEIEQQALENIRVVKVGCIGYCHSEPLVQVNMPGGEPIIYGNVDAERAKEIIQRHVMKKELLDNAILNKTFNKA